jgi:hypothetical protein
MKKIKLYELIINVNDELDERCLFDEGLFYKEWLSYINFSDFQKQVFNYLDNMKIKEIQGFADEDYLFAKNTDFAYERLPKCYKYYDERKLVIPSDISCGLFTRPEYAVDYVKIVKKNIDRWLNNIRKKENLNKEINF